MSEDPKTGEDTEPEADAPAAEEAPKPRRRRARAKATGEEAPAAEAAATRAEPEPQAEAAEPATEAPETETETETEAEEPEPDAPAPARRRRRRGAAAAEEEPAPAPATRTARPPGERVLVRAQARYVRTSARKARLVCDHIRGKSVPEARAILALTPRAVARDWTKLLESAVANAEHNHELLGDELRIHAVTADEGPTLKRFRPRAMGRATRIRKRTSHLTILLTPKEA
jgi:ribosomal protein L22